MARIRTIPRDRAALILRHLYDAAESQFGVVPNLFQSMAHRPELLLTFGNFYKELWTGGVLDAKTKEMAALRIAAVNGCRYSLARHSASALRAGLSEGQLAILQRDDWELARLFDERETAVLRLSEKLTRSPASITDDDLQALRKWYGEAHLVELTLLIGTLNLTSAFAQCFAVEPDAAPANPRP